MKILTINGSYHKNGTIAKALKSVLAIAEENGHETDIVNLSDANLAFCKGCYSCQTKGGMYIQS
ncbi:flavodoxin family protein [Rarispira pelagica]|uniref:flavodoxin family protein n=1 Tax=Rarispira pelagica TaxID=3141764 RepID=UPI003B280499